ncbi:ArsR/SmtB family transcription factor [Streptomyces sp. NPDC091412]|uniref:ArsR/SmtB family transcription factor n=1 Tax=Streptomyces sp. NPDC091412 TaxID=3366002 RepID=UPI003814EBA3
MPIAIPECAAASAGASLTPSPTTSTRFPSASHSFTAAALCSVGELAEAVGMEASACSHQLRLLRNLGLVTGERRGRSIIYALYDNHVAELLDQALYHVEHLRLGVHDIPAERSEPAAVD